MANINFRTPRVLLLSFFAILFAIAMLFAIAIEMRFISATKSVPNEVDQAYDSIDLGESITSISADTRKHLAIWSGRSDPGFEIARKEGVHDLSHGNWIVYDYGDAAIIIEYDGSSKRVLSKELQIRRISIRYLLD